MATPSTHPRVLGLGTCSPEAATQGGLPHIVWEWGDLGSVQGCNYHSVWTRGSLTSTHTLQSYECVISAAKKNLQEGCGGLKQNPLFPILMYIFSCGGESGNYKLGHHLCSVILTGAAVGSVDLRW